MLQVPVVGIMEVKTVMVKIMALIITAAAAALIVMVAIIT